MKYSSMMSSKIHSDCFHFNGYKPCKPHKTSGVHCENCPEYRPTEGNVLIIKLQAAGEVIRNTPLLHPIQKKYPRAKIFWLTNFPDLVPQSEVYRVLKFSPESVLLLQDLQFEAIYSLDKDLEACALANQLQSKLKKGFSQKDGVILPFDQDAEHKFRTGAFDDWMKENRRHYIDEIFEICGFSFQEEKYILPKYSVPENIKAAFSTDKPRVALNTGAGPMWKPRIYSESRWQELANTLLKNGYEVYLVGGPAEDEKNKRISSHTGAHYFGTFSYSDFFGVLSLADYLVSSVSFAFHVGVALQKKIILLNNTFNPHEFYMYGKGKVLEPEIPCTMCYKQDFDQNCVQPHCMDLILPQRILEEIQILS